MKSCSSFVYEFIRERRTAFLKTVSGFVVAVAGCKRKNHDRLVDGVACQVRPERDGEPRSLCRRRQATVGGGGKQSGRILIAGGWVGRRFRCPRKGRRRAVERRRAGSESVGGGRGLLRVGEEVIPGIGVGRNDFRPSGCSSLTVTGEQAEPRSCRPAPRLRRPLFTK